MGKKGGKSKGNVSLGLRISSMKTASKNPADRVMNQLKAFRAGKNVVVSIPNPNKAETNKPFIRVNGRDWFKQESNSQGNN